ncbi:GAF and ANTAR domain-containing protein [Amycolatopsis anabasis]|uniref:GAF and ANTAR domain-containing protein n=1 Tax=Amycolatopsis anabasis TaxID=1840409 RepID=UPI00131A7BD0|nr:GAF and ANTAR domain-containing protein [Amycolatopsis anabasis]
MPDSALEPTLVELADTTALDDLPEYAHRLAVRCAQLLPVTGAAVLLTGPSGRIAARAGEPAWIRFLLEPALAGPAVDCCDTAAAITVADLRTTRRWPAFTEAALGHGITAVTALPLRHGDHRLGAVALHRSRSALPARTEHLAQLLSEAASVGLRQWRERHSLRTALASASVIEQATGVLAERGHITLDEALHRLRGHASRERLRLHATARMVIGTLPPQRHKA